MGLVALPPLTRPQRSHCEVNRTGKDPVPPLTDVRSGAQIRVSDDWCQASLISYFVVLFNCFSKEFNQI